MLVRIFENALIMSAVGGFEFTDAVFEGFIPDAEIDSPKKSKEYKLGDYTLRFETEEDGGKIAWLWNNERGSGINLSVVPFDGAGWWGGAD